MVVEGEYGIFPPVVLRPLRALRRWLSRGVDPHERNRAEVGEHAVIVHLALSDDAFGSEGELAEVWTLEADLIAALESSPAGEYDGNEIGHGEAVFFMSGPNADRLLDVVDPALRSSSRETGGFVVKRYGPADDPAAPEVHVPLD